MNKTDNPWKKPKKKDSDEEESRFNELMKKAAKSGSEESRFADLMKKASVKKEDIDSDVARNNPGRTVTGGKVQKNPKATLRGTIRHWDKHLPGPSMGASLQGYKSGLKKAGYLGFRKEEEEMDDKELLLDEETQQELDALILEMKEDGLSDDEIVQFFEQVEAEEDENDDEEEGEEEEVVDPDPYHLSEITGAVVNQEPARIADIFDQAIKARLAPAVENYKTHIAQTMFADAEMEEACDDKSKKDGNVKKWKDRFSRTKKEDLDSLTDDDVDNLIEEMREEGLSDNEIEMVFEESN